MGGARRERHWNWHSSRAASQALPAATGHEGIATAEQLRPDAIVLDVKMPGLTGWEVLSALKLSEATQRIPVIMLTFMQEAEIGQALGAVDYLMKPINPPLLLSTLRRYTNAATARVLVVEDDEPTRTLVRRTLEARGNTVFEAENGKLGLERLDEAEPDIIILDLMLPVMDGFRFLEHLRRHPRLGNVPVVVATSRELGEDERRVLEARFSASSRRAHTVAETCWMPLEPRFIGALRLGPERRCPTKESRA